MDQNSQNVVLINTLRTAWPTSDTILKIFFSSTIYFIRCMYLFSKKKSVGNLEIEHYAYF